MNQREQKIKAFDPNGVGHPNGNLFGLPFTPEESGVIVIPVPWDVTASFRRGAANGPAAILEASYQIDLYDEDVPGAWKTGIAMPSIPSRWQESNDQLSKKAAEVILRLEKGEGIDSATKELQKEVNLGCQTMVSEVSAIAAHWIQKGKLVGVLGGDHSTALGLMHALRERYSKYGVLHIDAHFDLRDAFEGLEYSHASIMRNARDLEALKGDTLGWAISCFVHAGIRDYCDEELEAIAAQENRHVVFTERQIRRQLFEGSSWKSITDKMIRNLPDWVYVSFDIDGLDPSLCPNTGTPVPGGFNLEEVFYLISRVVDSGRKIIGFDLCEVAPASTHRNDWAGDWNANVGMRVLYRLSALVARSCSLTQ
ncbi:MAG: agmatinase family protein [Parcubacteria group bacterium]